MDRLQPHGVHQALNSFAIDLTTWLTQFGGDTTTAQERHSEIQLVDTLHQFQVLCRFGRRSVVPGRPVQFEQFTLSYQAEVRMLRLN